MKDKQKKPNRLAMLLLAVISNSPDRSGILGDFEEIYDEIRKSDGRLAADYWYWKQVILSLPNFIKNQIYWGINMFQNYLKIAIRNALKHKTFSVINMAGLALGLTVSLLIFLYVVNELTYDEHIENVDNKYRVGTDVSFQQQEMKVDQVAAPLGAILREKYPEVKSTVRMYSTSAIVSNADKVFKEEKLYYAEPQFFDMFSANLLVGDPATALNAPYSVVLTAETAGKYFGSEDPIGKQLKFNDKDFYTVTGIAEKFPGNSHFHADLIASFQSLYSMPNHARFINMWMGFNYKTYIELNDGFTQADLEEKFPGLVEEYTSDLQKQFNVDVALFLQPVKDIYLHTDFTSSDVTGDFTLIEIFAGIGVFILLIACVNFMNLSTARSSNRLREIGLRKVLGANRKKIISQFLGESVLLSFAGLFIAVIAAVLFLPVFNNLLEKDLQFSQLMETEYILYIILLALAVGIFAGSYPAFYSSAFQPVHALMGKIKSSHGNRVFRNSLVNFQFIISISLIFVTVVIYSQLDYLKSKDLGFDNEHVLILPLSGDKLKGGSEIFKNELKKVPQIKSISGSSLYPGVGTSETFFTFEGKKNEEYPVMPYIEVDEDYLETMGLKLLDGRFFSSDYPSDVGAIVINKTLANLLQWDDPIGKTIEMTDIKGEEKVEKISVPFKVIGVIDDYNFASLHKQIRPFLMIPSNRSSFLNKAGNVNYLNIKLTYNVIPETIGALKDVWNKIDASRPFTYFFLDETFDRLYRSELRLGEIFIYFTIIAIFISCLGLFGLATFTADQRVKEVGIRKTLGASVPAIVILLTRDFIRWVLLANIVAWPVAYYFMSEWLSNFAYRIEMNAYPFLISGLLAFIIAIATISIQTAKVAMTNPVDTLKYE